MEATPKFTSTRHIFYSSNIYAFHPLLIQLSHIAVTAHGLPGTTTNKDLLSIFWDLAKLSNAKLFSYFI